MSADAALNPSFQAHSPAQLHAAADPQVTWLWHGYLAAGNVTLLTSPWKAGKTTLTAALLARMGTGGELAGRAVQPGRAVVVSEESAAQWAGRCDKFGIGEQVRFICRPFAVPPRPDEWQSLITHLVALHQAAGLDLLVIDPLAICLPAGTSDPTMMLTALLPLQSLTTAGVAVLILHHPRKGASAAGNWARGSSALTGFADISLEMHYYRTAETDDRRRKLLAYSRNNVTPRRLVIELTETGTDWRSHGDIEDEAYTHGWRLLRAVLADASDKRTRPELLADWPAEEQAPSAITLYRWLERAVAAGDVLRNGSGTRGDPYRYWLKGQEAKWQADDPLWAYRQEGEQVLRELREAVRREPGKRGKEKG